MLSYLLNDGLYRLWAICSNQDGRHQTFKIYLLLKVIYACERDIFEVDWGNNFKQNLFSFSLEDGHYQFLGHLLKRRWLPSNFFKCML